METTTVTISDAEYYTINELALKLNVQRRTLEKWSLKRRLPVVKCGRLNRYPKLEIQKRLLNGNLLR